MKEAKSQMENTLS
ncbi:hypothetical protein SOVF_129680, partial [Spinacia oleracea]